MALIGYTIRPVYLKHLCLPFYSTPAIMSLYYSLLVCSLLIHCCTAQGMEQINSDDMNQLSTEYHRHTHITHLWSDKNILQSLQPSSINNLLPQSNELIETIIIFNLSPDTFDQLDSIQLNTDDNLEQPSYHSYVQHYSKHASSSATLHDIDILQSFLPQINGRTYNLQCNNINDLNELNSNAFAYNSKTDLLSIQIGNNNIAQSCIQKVLSRSGSKYIAGVYSVNNDISSNTRKLLQSSIPSQYVKTGPNINPQYPWSAVYQPSIPLINRPGPIYITSSIIFGLIVGLLLIIVLYTGLSVLAGVERPVRFATQPLNIGKEY